MIHDSGLFFGHPVQAEPPNTSSHRKQATILFVCCRLVLKHSGCSRPETVNYHCSCGIPWWRHPLQRSIRD